MKRERSSGILAAAALGIMMCGIATQAWGKPRHRVDRPNAIHHAQGRSDVHEVDTALPSGFVDVSQDTSGEEHSQGMVAVSPVSGKPLATLFYDSRSVYGVQAAYSPDGTSWSLSAMPSATSEINSSTGLSDPTVTADSQGRFYVGGGGPDPVLAGQTLKVLALRSDNGGVSFNTPSIAISLVAQQAADFLDHQSNWADSSGTTSNDYVSVSSIATIPNSGGSQSQVIEFNYSTDGAQTWVEPVSGGIQISDGALDAVAGAATPVTRTDSSGKVYVSWTGISSSNTASIVVDKAAIPTGGTFGTDVVVANLNSSADEFNAYLGDIRGGIFNALAVDNSVTATNGNVYVAWSDQAPTLGNTFKIFVARSQDGGNTFSAPVRADVSLDANGDGSDHQITPSIAVNPLNGEVVVSYYSTHLNSSDRGGPNSPLSTSFASQEAQTPLVDLLIAVGTPNAAGSLDFVGPFRVTPSSIDVYAADQASNLQYDPALGDYTGLDFRNVSNGVNSAVVFSTVDQSNRIVEAAAIPFDGSGTLTNVTSGTFEFKAAATAPVAGLAAFVDWGDGTNSTGLDLIHNYAAGSATATATVFDGSTALRTFTFSVASTGTFSNTTAAAGSSSVVSPNTLAALGSGGSGTTTTTTSGTGTTSGTTGTTSGTTGTTNTTTGTSSGDTTAGGSSNGGIQTNTGSGSGGCFIATAAYGSYFEPHVMTLRRFRDENLLTNGPGRAFVNFYYTYSPPVADWISTQEWARVLVRAGLTPLVFALEHTLLCGILFLAALLGGLGIWRQRRGAKIATQVPC